MNLRDSEMLFLYEDEKTGLIKKIFSKETLE
jgi:hypothetical protein